MRIADYLGRGAENAPPLRQLVDITGCGPRDVRRRIEAERRNGALILSNCRDGYYLPDSPDDLKRFSRSMARRAGKIMTVARMAGTAYMEALGQQALKGWQDV